MRKDGGGSPGIDFPRISVQLDIGKATQSDVVIGVSEDRFPAFLVDANFDVASEAMAAFPHHKGLARTAF